MPQDAQGRVFVVGSLNVDLGVTVLQLPGPGETTMGGDLLTSPGGKGGNAAVAAARLGAEVRMVAAVGDDTHAELLRTRLAAEAVDCTGVVVREGVASGVALIAVEPSGENLIVVAPGANARLDRSDVRSGLVALTSADVVVAQLEVPLDAVLEAATGASATGARFVLNAAPARDDLPRGVLSAADPLVVNEHEASALVGGATSPEAAAGELLQAGARSVVVTLGAAGALVADAHGVQAVPAAAVPDVVDATGAGDTLVGAVAGGLARGRDLREAVGLAVRAASMSVRASGAQASMPRRADLLES